MESETNSTPVRSAVFWGPGGGIGKTTFSVNSAAALGTRGHDVLAVDLDHQKGSLTSALGRKDLKVNADPDYDHLGDILVDHEPRMDELIESHTHFDFVPAHEGMDSFEETVIQRGVKNRESLLLSELRALSDDYDFFVVDPPATLGILVDNAIYAARNLVIPVELSEKGKDTINDVHATVEMMERAMQRADPEFELTILDIIPNFVRSSNIYDEIRAELEAEGKDIADVQLEFRDKLKSAWREGMDIYEYADAPDTDDLRPYEQDIFEAFEHVADRMEGRNTA